MPFIRTKDGSIPIIRKAEVFCNNNIKNRHMNHVTLDHSGTKNILGPSQPAGPFQWVFMGQIKTVRRSLSDSTYANIIGCMTSSVVNSKISKKVINE